MENFHSLSTIKTKIENTWNYPRSKQTQRYPYEIKVEKTDLYSNLEHDERSRRTKGENNLKGTNKNCKNYIFSVDLHVSYKISRENTVADEKKKRKIVMMKLDF